MRLLSKAAALGATVLAVLTVYEKIEDTKVVKRIKERVKREPSR